VSLVAALLPERMRVREGDQREPVEALGLGHLFDVGGERRGEPLPSELGRDGELVSVEAVSLGGAVVARGRGPFLASVGRDGVLQLLGVAIVEDFAFEEGLVEKITSDFPIGGEE
jgi:hypothetical protein